MNYRYIFYILTLLAVVLSLIFWLDNVFSDQQVLGNKITSNKNNNVEVEEVDNDLDPSSLLEIVPQDDKNEVVQNDTKKVIDNKTYHKIIKVVDGDTVDLLINNKVERVRLVGINTPEIVDPRKPVECFGREASDIAKELLSGQKVLLEIDDTQDERDKYGRLLGYIFRDDGLFYNQEIIKQGYAYEYTYRLPYKYQSDFRAAQAYARDNKLGLWATGACDQEVEQNTEATSDNSALPDDPNCLIKGNINSKGDKIYHLPECSAYSKTKITKDKGEQYFCSEASAAIAGWRKAMNCP